MLAYVTILSVHVICAVMWAGSTFADALTGTVSLAYSRWPRIAGVLTILTGALAWRLLRIGWHGEHTYFLEAGAALALLAGFVQAITAVLFASDNANRNHHRVLAGQRIAALCLAAAIVCMVA